MKKIDHHISVRFKQQIFILSIVVCVCSFTACLPDPQLTYPLPPSTFSDEVPEVLARTDALPPPDIDMMNEGTDLEPPLDEGLIDLGMEDPVLRTTGLDFIGSPQRTHNSPVPRIRGRFLWHTRVETTK